MSKMVSELLKQKFQAKAVYTRDTKEQSITLNAGDVTPFIVKTEFGPWYKGLFQITDEDTGEVHDVEAPTRNRKPVNKSVDYELARFVSPPVDVVYKNGRKTAANTVCWMLVPVL